MPSNPKGRDRDRRAGQGSELAEWDVNAAMATKHDHRHALAVAYLQRANPATELQVATGLRPMLDAYLRVAYPAAFPPGALIGPFCLACEQALQTSAPLLNEASLRELRSLKDYANRFHHDTNPAYATEIINDGELTDFTGRTLAFIGRP